MRRLLNRRNTVATAVAVGLGLAGLVVAGEPREGVAAMRPATFGKSDRSLLALLSCPAADRAAPDVPVEVTVWCQALVTATGSTKPRLNNCSVRDRKLDVYRRSTEQALWKAEFVPAAVDNRPVSVLMSFRVLFRQARAACDLFAIPNPGFDPDMADDAYVAPQRIMGPRPLTEIFRSSRPTASTLAVPLWNRELMAAVSTLVAPDGTTSNSRIEKTNPRFYSFEVVRPDWHERYRFIPGARDNGFTPVRYYGFIY